MACARAGRETTRHAQREVRAEYGEVSGPGTEQKLAKLPVACYHVQRLRRVPRPAATWRGWLGQASRGRPPSVRRPSPPLRPAALVCLPIRRPVRPPTSSTARARTVARPILPPRPAALPTGSKPLAPQEWVEADGR